MEGAQAPSIQCGKCVGVLYSHTKTTQVTLNATETVMDIGLTVLLLAMAFFLVIAAMVHATGTVRSARTTTDTRIASYLRQKYVNQAQVSGYHQVAKNLRKQGVPLEIALLILFGK